MSEFKVGDMLVRVDNDISHSPVGWCVELKEVGFYIDKYGRRTVLVDSLWKLVAPKAKQDPNPPHVHSDLIIAWANGTDIEIQDKIGKWHDIEEPTWYENGIYRAKSTKPTKTPLQLKIEKCEAKLAKLKGQL
tara:strand:- start:1707 stop:2105 length:399 start_codon:yes stop_codon:yes gene_type:complete